MATGVEVLNSTQTVRKLVLLLATVLALAVIALVATPATMPGWHEGVEDFGRVLLIVCIVGRCWCTLYIGGRKGAELVDTGPYSICRNPLYFFSFVGGAGIGAQTGSLVLTALFTTIAWAVFRVTVAREEAFLKGALGQPYASYLTRVPRFLPNPSLWQGKDILEVQPRRVVLTFVDGLFFLVAIPLAEAIEWLQADRVIPVLLHLP